MRSISSMRAACALLAGAALSAAAQPMPTAAAPAAPAPQAADPTAAVAPLHYRSSLQHYQALRETAAGDWREANRRAREAGGWRAYAREAAAPDAAASAPAPAPVHSHHPH